MKIKTFKDTHHREEKQEMKTEMEVINGSVMVIDSLDHDMKVVIDIQTAEVIHFEHTGVDINKLERFTKAARSRYKRFMTSQAAEDFKL